MENEKIAEHETGDAGENKSLPPLESTEYFRKLIVGALKSAERYNKSLEIQILSLASALRSLQIANRDLDELDSTVVATISRYGNESLAPHPVFKILKDTQDSITRQMKALGLTAEDLIAGDDDDPLYALTRQVKKTGTEKRVIVKRDKK